MSLFCVSESSCSSLWDKKRTERVDPEVFFFYFFASEFLRRLFSPSFLIYEGFSHSHSFGSFCRYFFEVVFYFALFSCFFFKNKNPSPLLFSHASITKYLNTSFLTKKIIFFSLLFVIRNRSVFSHSQLNTKKNELDLVFFSSSCVKFVLF